MMEPHVVVIGGGITGLSAAWSLQRQMPGMRVTVLEQSRRWGGKLISEPLSTPGGEALVEGGPESFVTRKPEVWELAHELGLQAQLVAAPSNARRTRVFYAGRALPVPLDPLTFLTTPLLSPRGKLRMLLEPFIPPRRDPGDESLAAFVDRRLGREARERFIGPILAGIYNADPDTQSILTASPVMRELERHGSLMRGSLARMRARRRTSAAERPPQFISFAGGVQVLADTLVQRLAADLRSQTTVAAIAPGPVVVLANGERLPASAVIVTAAAHVAADLLRASAPRAAAGLARIRHNDIGTISLLYREAGLAGLPSFSGLMIPRRERRAIDAVTCLRPAASPRVPAGSVLLKVFFGGSQPAMVALDDAPLQEAVTTELRALLGVAATPLGAQIYRWPGQFPQADVGHLDLVALVERDLPEGVLLAGASYRGVGVPDCIRQGREAAQQAVVACMRAGSARPLR